MPLIEHHLVGGMCFSVSSDLGLKAPAWSGFQVMMTPRQFLSLVPELHESETLDDIEALVLSGAAFCFPVLVVEFEPDGDLDAYPRILRHDGRHRLTALVAAGSGDLEMPVWIDAGRTSSDMTSDHIIAFRSAVWAQVNRDEGVSRLAKGPHFGAAMMPDGRTFKGADLDEIYPFIRSF